MEDGPDGADGGGAQNDELRKPKMGEVKNEAIDGEENEVGND